MCTIHLRWLLLLGFVFNSCATGRNNTNALPEFSVSFGKTGGFTNTNPAYTIQSSGVVTSTTGRDSQQVYLKKLPKAEVDSVFQLLKQTGFLNYPIHKPGNISYFIECKIDTLQRKIIWNDHSQLTPDIKKLHFYLIQMIKK